MTEKRDECEEEQRVDAGRRTSIPSFKANNASEQALQQRMVWHDIQAKLNKINHTIKLLKLVPDEETVEHRTDRLALRREDKKCLRVHQDHIRQGAVAQLDEAEEALDTASRQTDYSTTALQGLRDQVRNLQQYQEGLHPTEPRSLGERNHQLSKVPSTPRLQSQSAVLRWLISTMAMIANAPYRAVII